MKVTNESVEEIRHSNNSKGFDKADDTKDGKQIKNINKGATFTSFEYLLTACERISYSKIDEVKNAIEMLKKIYEK